MASLNNNLKSLTMKEVFIMIPFLRASQQSLSIQIQKHLKLPASDFELHQLDQDKYIVELSNMQLGFAELESIVEEHGQFAKRLEIIENNLKNMEWTNKQVSIHSVNIDSLMKKAMKYKEVKEENRKLKKLLQNQLQNTQKVREQTQKTMKVLRGQFDTLVKQMNRQGQDKKLHVNEGVLEKLH